MHCAIFRNKLDLSPLDASSASSLAVATKNISRHCPVFSGGQSTWLTNTAIEGHGEAGGQ